MKDRRHNLIPKLIGASSFFIMLFVSLVTYFTWFDTSKPVKFYEGQASLFENADKTLLLSYSRNIEVFKRQHITINRVVLYSNGGDEIILPGSDVVFKLGKRTITRVYSLPPTMKTGEWCIIAYIHWKHDLSLSVKTDEAPKICFVKE